MTVSTPPVQMLLRDAPHRPRAHRRARPTAATIARAIRPHRVPGGLGPEARLGDFLEFWARVRPDEAALTFIDYLADRHGLADHLTFAAAERWSRAIAARIDQLTTPGDRVAILAPQGAEYYAAFAGALRSEAVAVPLYAPDLPGHGDRLTTVLADCAPTLILTTSAKRALVEEHCAHMDGLDADRIISLDELRDDRALAAQYVRPRHVHADSPAYLQYTSGSTRSPAGVVLSHRNVVSNVLQLAEGNDLQYGDTTCVSWLPLFHDMGLLLGVAGPVVGGAHSVLLDPVAFVLKPQRWLSAISSRRNVITAAPNFAYDYVVKRAKPDEIAALDLSGVSVWMNGAEPIRPETLDRFVDRLAPAGVRREALCPAYGLAEATVFVTSTDPARAPQVAYVDPVALQTGSVTPAREGEPSVALVSCGRAVGQHLAIVDPDTRERLADGQVGEIWLHGPNVAHGYWTTPEGADTFDAQLVGAGDLPATGWLRTEDLGTLIDGELYVTGRIKDLIIIDGRNLYPQDIERTIQESDDAIARGRLAAFSVTEHGAETIVVVAERHRNAQIEQVEHLVALAKAAVTRDHAAALHDIVIVEPDTIPRTSSGKIARSAAREQYLAGALTRT